MLLVENSDCPTLFLTVIWYLSHMFAPDLLARKRLLLKFVLLWKTCSIGVISVVHWNKPSSGVLKFQPRPRSRKNQYFLDLKHWSTSHTTVDLSGNLSPTTMFYLDHRKSLCYARLTSRRACMVQFKITQSSCTNVQVRFEIKLNKGATLNHKKSFRVRYEAPLAAVDSPA